MPLDWATTQNNLGGALGLGERESGTARLEEAVAAYREALEERTRERVPLEWARTQKNLGKALRSSASGRAGRRGLEEAVAAYREALEERTRARVPLSGPAQMNLGNCARDARRAGERDGAARGGGCRLSRGLAGKDPRARAAPLGHDPEQSGSALARLGERESGTARLEEAVAAYREALQERTRARVPLEWARTQVNLALVHLAFFDKDRQPRHLDAALEAVDGALEEYRKANAAFYIDKAERLREQILAAKAAEPRPARRSQNSANVAPPNCSRGSRPL